MNTGEATDPGFDGRLRADPRLPAYIVAGFGALIVAITLGRFDLAVLGAPFLALAGLGVLNRSPARPRAQVIVHAGRIIEDDIVDGEIHVAWYGEAEVDVVLTDTRGIAPVEPAPILGWSLPAGAGPAALPFRVRATAWGAHEPGTVWVRIRRPGALLAWEGKLAQAPPLRVLPTPLRLDRLLKPAEPRTASGMHLARIRGHGTDFAELRPYRPGDRMRDLSWATSARLGKPWVAVHHPERTGTVLLLLDAFAGDDAVGRESLARAARAAWAIASVHLRAQDRVGLLAQGRTLEWLPPRGGRRARWQLMDALLAVGAAAQDSAHRAHRRPRVVVPSDALVVGVTALGWPVLVRDLLHHRHSGHTTVAFVIDTSDLLAPARDDVDVAARRLWLAQRESERMKLERAGIPTAVVGPGAGVGAAVSVLRRRTRTSRPASRT